MGCAQCLYPGSHSKRARFLLLSMRMPFGPTLIETIKMSAKLAPSERRDNSLFVTVFSGHEPVFAVAPQNLTA